jgi:ubiquinone biosynthesis protein Coq4
MNTDIQIARGLIGAASIAGGPTQEQINLVQSLLHGYFGADADARSLAPLSAKELASVVDPEDRHRVADLLVVLEFCRHPYEEAQADLVEEYVGALGVDEPMLILARDAIQGEVEKVAADWSRLTAPPSGERAKAEQDRDYGAKLRALEKCPPLSLGRTYFQYYQQFNSPFPGEDGGPHASVASHDFDHVITGYDTDPPGELALQAMLLASNGFHDHFSSLVASLLLYETASLPFLTIIPKEAVLDRDGAMDLLANGFLRGQRTTVDCRSLDHMAIVDRPLAEIRSECGIEPLAQPAHWDS